VYEPESKYEGGTPPGRPTRFWIMLGVGVAMIAILVIVAVLIYTGSIGFGAGPHPYYGYWGGFFLLFLLLWVSFFVIRMAFWSSRPRRQYYRQQYGPGMGRDPAVMAARQRYARGEITREQFDQIVTDLGRRGRGPGGPLSGG
jgi:uncharacterized membrane protein